MHSKAVERENEIEEKTESKNRENSLRSVWSRHRTWILENKESSIASSILKARDDYESSHEFRGNVYGGGIAGSKFFLFEKLLHELDKQRQL